MSNLFLDGIFDFQGQGNDSPSAVFITIPNQSDKLSLSDESASLVGLMIGDPTWGAANSWGTIINDVSNLTDISSLIGSESMFSWINASTMCWKGTAPLNIGIEFYLINYKKDLDLESKLRSFVKLASLYRDPDATVGANFKVLVHGGYAADVITGNKKLYDSARDVAGLRNREGLDSVISGVYGTSENAKGSVQLQFGHKSKISNLLLSKVNVTESTIEVADQNGRNVKPLYYRVSAQFTGVKPLLTVDVDKMFVGGNQKAGGGGLWSSNDGNGRARVSNKVFTPSGYSE